MIFETLKYVIYFILGGLIVVLATYFGIERKGLMAAFFAMFPFVTAFTMFTIYSAAGSEAVINYLKGLLLLTPVWVSYLLIILYLVPKYGFWISMTMGVLIYLLIALIFILKY